MNNITKKSGILIWSEENINTVPNNFGVYVIRSSPTNGAIISIEFSTNLREDLLRHYKEETFSDAKFFDWYLTNTEEEAKSLCKEWKIKYNLQRP